jgi:drug/metabolite transporter (DMT)-like permease
VIPLLCGLGTAFAFAASTVCSSRSARMIGWASAAAWVMLAGFVVAVPIALAGGVPSGLDAPAAGWLLIAGAGNLGGILLTYSALRVGKVWIVAAIVSTEGAVAALLAVLAGQSLAPAAGATLAVIATGVVLAALAPGAAAPDAPSAHGGGRAVAGAVTAAFAFGASLYATAKAGATLPVSWAVLPSRVIGVAVLAVPLALAGRLRLTRPAAPLVVISGLCEIVGFALFTVGSREDIAVTSVVASQFAAIAAIAAFVLFGERLRRLQVAGVALIVAGVGVLAVVQA